MSADRRMQETRETAITKPDAPRKAVRGGRSETSMRAVRFLGNGVVEVSTLPRPTPRPGQVLLRVTVAGICQTDVHIVAGDFAVRPPRVLGHELAGEVTEVGPEVSRDWIGQTVGIQPAIYCGTCRFCLSDMPEQCLNFRCLGNTEDGGWAEFTTANTNQLIPLDGLTPRIAVWLEPIACVVHGLSMIRPPVGADVLVIGAGPMGLLAAQALPAAGARRVAVTDVNPGKLSLATEVGADFTLAVPRTGPTAEADAAFAEFAPFGFQFVLETTGKPVAIERAMRWAARRGTIALFGVSRPDDRLTAVSPSDVFTKELTIVGTSGSTPDAFKEAQRLLATGAVETEALIWRVTGLEDVPALVEKLAQPGKKGKILIDPTLT